MQDKWCRQPVIPTTCEHTTQLFAYDLHHPLITPTHEDWHTQCTEGKFAGTTPLERWNAQLAPQGPQEACVIWQPVSPISSHSDFEVWEGTHTHVHRLAWLLYHGEIEGCIDATHNSGRIRNCCHAADCVWDSAGMPMVCVNPQHMQVEQRRIWCNTTRTWFVYGA